MGWGMERDGSVSIWRMNALADQNKTQAGQSKSKTEKGLARGEMS